MNDLKPATDPVSKPTMRPDVPSAGLPDDVGDDDPTHAALLRLCAARRHTPEWASLREEVIRAHLLLARRLASRFQHRGEELDDLTQVAVIGLIKALDRYEPSRGTAFAQYAVPTMLGELKRHFRDRAWSLRVHRSLQDLHLDVGRALPRLSQELQRTPSVADIAADLGVREDLVHAAIGVTVAYQPRSLDAPLRGGDGATRLADQIGQLDHELERLTDRLALGEAMITLAERDRHILRWRFVDNLTQSEIGDRLGVSQMHVSRLLNSAFARLRLAMADDG
jgi:RNA polymerase sigma-B factor